MSQAQLALGDRSGFETLLNVLHDAEASMFARQQASDLVEAAAERKFGYSAEKSVLENATAIHLIRGWIRSEAPKMR